MQRIKPDYEKEIVREQPKSSVLNASGSDSNVWPTILVSTVVLAIILSFTSYEINLEPHAPSITTNLEPVNGSLLSWNLRDFGQTKNARELEWISKIVKNFDLVAIQEVVAGPGGARAVALLADELNRTGAKWDYRISNPTQSPSYKTERYAFLWKTGKVKIVGSPWLERPLSQKIYREPFLARFTIKEDTFLIANYHSRNSRENPEEELKHLFQLPDDYPDDILIFAGDFNLEANHPVFRIIYNKGYVSSPHSRKTTLKTQCNNGEYLSRAIDYIFYPSKKIASPQGGVIDFVGGCSQLKLGRQISDHLPVWAQLGAVGSLK